MNKNSIALMQQRDFAILRHGLRYLRLLVDAGKVDLESAGVRSEDLAVLDYKVANIIDTMRQSGTRSAAAVEQPDDFGGDAC